MTTESKDQGWQSLESYAREARGIVADVTECEECGHDGTAHRLEVHHVDGDPTNNARDNLRRLCSGCHGRRHAHERERCRAEACAQDVYARAVCQKHYMRWYRARRQGMTRTTARDPGELQPEDEPKPEREAVPDTCQVSACSAEHYARGRCYNHYMKDYRRRRRDRFLGEDPDDAS